MLAQLSPPWNEVDLLLNNAGFATPTTPLPETDWHWIEDVIQTNVTGLVALTRALLPKVLASAAAIIADSHATRADLERFYRVPRHRIEVVYPGVDDR